MKFLRIFQVDSSVYRQIRDYQKASTTISTSKPNTITLLKCQKSFFHKHLFLNKHRQDIHALWDCPLLIPFWRAVLKKFEDWIGQSLPKSAQFCLLVDKSFLPKGPPKAEGRLMMTGFVVAARIILCKWKSPHRPEFQEWLQLISETAAFEVMISRVQKEPSKACQAWVDFDSSVGLKS